MGDLTAAITGMILVAIIFGALVAMDLMWIVPEIWEWIKPIIHEFTK